MKCKKHHERSFKNDNITKFSTPRFLYWLSKTDPFGKVDALKKRFKTEENNIDHCVEKQKINLTEDNFGVISTQWGICDRFQSSSEHFFKNVCFKEKLRAVITLV